MKGESIFFKSKAGNCYFYSAEEGRVFLSHPVLSYLFDLDNKGMDIKEWIFSLKKRKINIKNVGTFSKKEIKYYYSKYMFLKKKNFFSEVDLEERVSGRLTPEQIKFALASAENITYEVTDSCNLDCSYCIYSKLYTHIDKREKKFLSVGAAKNFIQYLADLRKSVLDSPYKKRFHIGFYGGEPLLNFAFIEEIVRFVKEHEGEYNYDLSFGITTNGLLLARYMDFLVENDFDLLISLDGNEKNNGYRVFSNGKPSYKKVIENISALRTKYPAYFKSNVKFNAVLHKKNSISEIYRFFKENFQKVPMFSEAGDYWVADSHRREFDRIYRNASEDLKQAENYPEIEREMFLRLPNIKNIIHFVDRFSGCVFPTYNDFFISKQHQKSMPTGTCKPFEKKIFVTVNGKIFPCEQIGHWFVLGRVDEKNININVQEVAQKYNKLYEKAEKCCSCYVSGTCNKCIFFMLIDNETFKCRSFMNKDSFSKYLSEGISSFEKRPELYNRIMNEVDYA